MPQQQTKAIAHPSNIAEYIAWQGTRDDLTRITSTEGSRYQLVTARMLEVIAASDLWKALEGQLPELNDAYHAATGDDLLLSKATPTLAKKPYESVISKVLRHNVLRNDAFPSPPEGGWIDPSNWFSRVRDVVRTQFVVKYIDGVEFLSEGLSRVCSDAGATACKVDFEARREGYYAAHVNVQIVFPIPSSGWDTQEEPVWIEFQVTTQLQEVISKLLHYHYEQRRMECADSEARWMWDYKSDEFATNYLGHILHYVEGMIADIRERLREEVGS